MDWQLNIVWLIVALATVYLARRAWRTWSGTKAGCGGACACSAKPAAPSQGTATPTWIPAKDLVLRGRDSDR